MILLCMNGLKNLDMYFFYLKALALKKEYTELHKLVEDILIYQGDVAEIREREKRQRLKEEQHKKTGKEMRLAAIQGMNS